MTHKTSTNCALRSKAEEALKSVEDSSIEYSGEDMRKLIHELQVHQVELEMQNEELRGAQAQIEESRRRYTDLYDFAPIGYLTFDQQGLIVEANLTAAKQLGTERAILLKKPFFLFLLAGNRDAFRLHLAKVFKTRGPQTCEVKLNPRKSEGFFARLDSIFIEDASGKGVVRTSISDISCSKHAEEVLKRAHGELEDRVAERTTELKAAAEKYRRIFDWALEGLYETTPDGKSLTANPAMAKMQGYDSPEELVSTILESGHLWVDPTQRLEYVRLLEENDVVRNYECQLYCKDRTKIWVSLNARRIPGPDGKTLYYLGFAEDVTERKRVENQLRESEERYRALVETSSDWVWEVDANAKYTYADPKVYKILGYTPDEVLGRTPFELMPEEEAQRVGSEFAEIAAEKRPFSGLLNVNLRRDGQEVVLETSGAPIFGLDGEFIGYRGMDRDVTERILAEKALRESEERFRFMVETTGDVLYRLRYDTMNYDYLSPGIGKLTGYSPEEIKTIGFSRLVTRIDLLGQEDVPTKVILEDRLAGKTGEYRADYLITTKTGTSKWLRDHSFPWYDDSGKNIGSVGVLSDSTDYKQAEEELRKNEERLRLTLEANSEGVWDWDIPSGKAFFSQSYSGMLGYEPEEFPKDYADWKELIHPEDFKRIDQAHTAHIQERQEFCVEFRMRKKSGDWCWIRSRGTVIERDSEDRAIRMVGTHLDITDSKLAAKALRASDEVNRATFEQAAVGIAHVGIDGHWLRVNDRLCAIVGYPREELMRLTFQDITHPEDLEKDLDYVRRMLSGEIKTYSIEKRYLRKDRSQVWANLTVSLVRRDTGEPQHFISVLADITERKMAEDELKETNAYLINVLENSPDAIGIVDKRSKFVKWNKVATELYGYSFEDLRGKSSLDLFTDRDEMKTMLKDLRWHGSVKKREMLMKRKDGSVSPFEISIGLLQDSEGRVLGSVSVGRDVSEIKKAYIELKAINEQLSQEIIVRKRAEEEVQRLSRRNQVILDASIEGIIGLDLAGRAIFSNPAGAELVGYEIEELIQKDFHQAVHHSRPGGAPYPADECPMFETLRTGVAWRDRDEVFWRKDGTSFPVAYSSTPILEEGQIVGGVLTFRDITSRKLSELEVRKLREDLAHASRVSMFAGLTSALAHEINQPLGAILNYARAAQRFLAGAEPKLSKVSDALQGIIRDDIRAAEVILRIRSMLKKEEIRYESLSLNEVIEEILSDICNDTALAAVSIVKEFDPALPPILGDRIQLQQVIINLTSNAAAAMSRVMPDSPKLVFRTEVLKNHDVKVSVRDFGEGIDDEHKDWLFEPFYTTKPEGFGMGLAICHNIIDAHGGVIWAENNPDGGATFYFTLKAAGGSTEGQW